MRRSIIPLAFLFVAVGVVATAQRQTTPTIDQLIIYKGFEGVGHGPSKPKSSRAVMQHNLDWFDQYIFGTTSQNNSQQEK